MFILIFLFILIFSLFYFMNEFLKKKENFENKNKCAIVIPIHPKHYEYGKNIVESLSNDNCDADLYFVFTNEEDKNNFKYLNKKVKSIILNEHVDDNLMKNIEKNGSWVSTKKLIALKTLYNKYEYITCIDSEIIFLKNNNFYNMMKEVYEQKKILGAKINTDELKNIIKNSSIAKNQEDEEKIKKITNDYTIYTWWNNVPVYKSDDIEDFFNFIGFDNLEEFLKRINWYYFENLSYNYYCLVKRGFELIIEETINTSIEHCDSSIVENINNKILKLFWVPNKSYKKNKDYYDKNDFYIVYHMDLDR